MKGRLVVSMAELAEDAGHMGYSATNYPGYKEDQSRDGDKARQMELDLFGKKREPRTDA